MYASVVGAMAAYSLCVEVILKPNFSKTTANVSVNSQWFTGKPYGL